jgi:2-C-methyl-D-erythritol 2,4-cyclodiphosphate synthase
MTTDIRIGQGFDVHRFAETPEHGRVLVLGGVTFPGERTLVGHSDADVVAHAVADAMLGAAGLGDIGMHFRDTDPQWKGADSLKILAEVARMVRAEGWGLANADCSVVCESPKIAPAREQMMELLTAAAGGPVSVKGRRAEGLGAIGRNEGIMCFASALLVRR